MTDYLKEFLNKYKPIRHKDSSYDGCSRFTYNKKDNKFYYSSNFYKTGKINGGVIVEENYEFLKDIKIIANNHCKTNNFTFYVSENGYMTCGKCKEELAFFDSADSLKIIEDALKTCKNIKFKNNWQPGMF